MKNSIAPPIRTISFCENNTRDFQILSSSTGKTVRYGIETVSYRSPVSCANLQKDFKSKTPFHEFKVKIRKRNAEIYAS